jgi:ADP-L-glycero-D-manno-heptose 6-epimerase
LYNPGVDGLFNIGSGTARTWLDLAEAVFAALDRPAEVEFIDMPPTLQAKYQYFTEAPMDKLRAAGYPGQFTRLEDGVDRYVRGYLTADDPYR